jgi:hypothetical protein
MQNGVSTTGGQPIPDQINPDNGYGVVHGDGVRLWPEGHWVQADDESVRLEDSKLLANIDYPGYDPEHEFDKTGSAYEPTRPI